MLVGLRSEVSALDRLDNNEMKLTKPAKARLAQSSQLISVLARRQAVTQTRRPSRTESDAG
jgi:hypothetical protein